ncbi:hypothetical protein [Vibrio sp. VPAP30]|uniref:hypothetical protein n=1 Tax=Vibrio sp. VPAP30 TaxID=1647102 RepID=UPI00065914F8|nr:hypothetical protein [Vibrio sp. VPAP30]KLN67220.1 hypothetical protein ZX61_00020 [Vibrio sp. VPAP30]
MFEHQKKYEAFIREQGVGQNDKVADSCKSYVSYLNGVEKHANIRINAKTLASENDISVIVVKLHESHEVSDRTIGNYVSAMRQYVNMVNQSAPHLSIKFEVRHLLQMRMNILRWCPIPKSFAWARI